jgi:hypothetical protein
MAREEESEGEPRQRPGEHPGEGEGAGGHASAERQREDPREPEDQHQTPRGGGGRDGEPALLEVALVEVQGRRLAGPLHRRAGVVRQAKPLGHRRGRINVGDDAGTAGRVRGERARRALRGQELPRITPRGDDGPELVAVRC